MRKNVLYIAPLIQVLLALAILLFFTALVVFVVVLMAYLIALNLIENNFSYHLILVFVVLLTLAVCLKKYRVVFLAVGFLFFIPGIVEKVLVYQNEKLAANFYNQGEDSFISEDSILGYAARREYRKTVTALYQANKLYSATYTTDENGLRKVGVLDSWSGLKSVFFFGDELVFGGGLNDQQTIPYLVQEQVKNRKLKIYNLGFFEYGPNQMLASIRSGRIDSITGFEPKLFLYFANTAQIGKYLNKPGLKKRDPQFSFNVKSDDIIYEGNFENRLVTKVQQSKLGRRFYEKEIIGLFERMISKTRVLIEKRYPDAQFHIIFIDDNTEINRSVKNKLLAMNHNIHLISDIIPDYHRNHAKYCLLYPFDLQSNYLANKKISRYIVEEIICE